MKTRIVVASTCPICCRAAASPFRSHDAQGHIVSGCVDHFHTGHLVTPSSSAAWHARPEAKRARAALRAGRDGFVTQVTAD